MIKDDPQDKFDILSQVGSVARQSLYHFHSDSFNSAVMVSFFITVYSIQYCFFNLFRVITFIHYFRRILCCPAVLNKKNESHHCNTEELPALTETCFRFPSSLLATDWYHEVWIVQLTQFWICLSAYWTLTTQLQKSESFSLLFSNVLGSCSRKFFLSIQIW